MNSKINLFASTEELLKALYTKLESNKLSEEERYNIKVSINFLTTIKKTS